MKFNLPDSYKPYIDKYFLRAKEVLEKDNLNPVVKAQVFLRQIPDKRVYGINEAIAILTKYSDIEKTGHISAIEEGTLMKDNTTVMNIEAPIQSIIDLETMYLGVLSSESTLKNGIGDINLKDIETRMSQVVFEATGRPVSYFGARHWRYDRDYDIAKTCKAAGATNCSTDEGARAWGEEAKGIGTIPHALEAIYHWKYGLKKAVVEATKAFDKHMDPSIPRIALIDYANREITDTVLTITEIPHLYGIRIDTCGENYMQGNFASAQEDEEVLYSFNKGVSILGTAIMHEILKTEGKYKLILSSGFGKYAKVQAFIEAEKEMGYQIFDGLGVGGVFDSRMATMDIIEVDGQTIHKVGRVPKVNERLKKVI